MMHTYSVIQRRREWVEALRSGEYDQGVGRLMVRVGNLNEDLFEYCCLGVACEITDPLQDRELWRRDDMPPDGIAVQFGLADGEDDPDFYANLNDKYHWTFDEIADAIELRVL